MFGSLGRCRTQLNLGRKGMGVLLLAIASFLLFSTTTAGAVESALTGVGSSTHPVETTWYADDDPSFEWTGQIPELASVVPVLDHSSFPPMPDNITCSAIAGDVLYVGSDTGLYSYDISNELAPVPLDYHPSITGYVSDIEIHGDFAYLATESATIYMVDISNPAAMAIHIAVIHPGSQPVEDIAVDGDTVYFAEGSDGIRIMRVAPSSSSPLGTVATPFEVFAVDVSGDTVVAGGNGFINRYDVVAPGALALVNTYATGVVTDVEIDGGILYASTTGGVQAFDMSGPALTPLSSESIPFCASLNVWGDILQVGRIDGLSLLDISDPTDIQEFAQTSSPMPVMDVAMADDVLYAASFSMGIAVFDTADECAPTVLDSIDPIVQARDITINGDVGYIAAGVSGMASIDISDPGFLRTLDTTTTGVNDIAIEGDIAYAAGGGGGLRVFDVSDPSAITRLASVSPGTMSATSVAVDGDYVYVGTTSTMQVLSVDVSNPLSPVVAATGPAIGASATDMDLAGDVLYISGTGGSNCLTAMDVSNPLVPAVLDTIDTRPMMMGAGAGSVDIEGDVAYIADEMNGLVSIDISDPSALSIIDIANNTDYSSGVDVVGNTAYLADEAAGVRVFDVTDPSAMVEVDSFSAGGGTDFEVTVEGGIAWLSQGGSGMRAVQTRFVPEGYSWSVDTSAMMTPDVTVDVMGSSVTATDTPDGLNYFHVVPADGAVCGTQVLHRAVRVDNTAPIINAIGTPDPSGPPTVTVTITASDGTGSGVASVYYRVDGGAPQLYTLPFDITTHGDHEVVYWGLDNAGNLSADVLLIDGDTDAPEVTDDCPDWWVDSFFDVTIDATDLESGPASIDITITAPSGVSTSTVAGDQATVPITADGTTTIEYSATDEAGNTSAPQMATALLDTTRPGIVIDAPSAWSSAPVTVSIEASDTTSGLDYVDYWLGGIGPIEYTGPFQVDIEGVTSITARAVDIAGNSTMAVPDEVRLDYTPMTIDDDVPSGWQTADMVVTFDLADDASGIGTATMELSNPPNTSTILFGPPPGPEFMAASLLTHVTLEGTTTISYRGSDWVGNTGTTETVTLLIDKTAPASAVYHPMGWQSAAVDVSVVASDNASGVGTTFYRMNGGATYTYSAPFNVSSEGTTTIDFWSVDVAGNVEATQTTTVMIDYDAPRVMDDCPNYWVDSFFDVMIEIEDDVSGPESIDVTVTLPPPSGVMTMTVPSDVATIPITIDGTTTIEYTGTDVAGNTTDPQVAVARLDTISPSVDVTASVDWSSTPVTVTVEASDTPSGVDYIEYRIDGGDATKYVGPFAQALEGVHTVVGTAYDLAGNAATATVTTYTDYTAPVTTDDSLDTYTGSAAFTLTATDTPGAGATDSSGVAYTEWRPTGGEWTTGTVVSVAGVGDHTIEYRSVDNAGNTEEIRLITFHIFADGSYGVIRVWGDDRFETGVETARASFDPDHDGTWPGVDEVIVASGMGVLADPLPSAGLVWAYDAPLLLLNPHASTPAATSAIKQISASHGATITIHVVGGTQAMPQSRIDEIVAAVPGPVVVDRLRTGGDRFDMAATIAQRVSAEWESRNGTDTAPERVLLANGFDQNAFFDALALSAVSASEGYPILLLKQNEVPAATAATLTSIDPTETIVAGGPVVVSDPVVNSLGATRWWGADRYDTALSVAENSVARGWLERKLVGISASLSDALSDGGPLGRHNGVSLLTRTDSLPPSTKAWLETHQPEVEDCFIFGGPVAVAPEVKEEVEQALKW